MNTHSAIIVDDEISARNVLNKLITKFCPNIEIVAEASNVPEAVQHLKHYKPQLVFLDIEMPNYAGYELVNFFDQIDFEIIFVTAYESYAIKAFEVSAFDYLLKPVEVSRLKQSVQRFIDHQQLRKTREDYELLKGNLKQNQIQNIILRKQNDSFITPVSDIIAVQAQQAYSKIITINESYTSSKNLKHFQNLFQENSNFFRSHKSWLVNKDYISGFSKSKMEITLRNDLIAKLSKYKLAEFKAFLEK